MRIKSRHAPPLKFLLDEMPILCACFSLQSFDFGIFSGFFIHSLSSGWLAPSPTWVKTRQDGLEEAVKGMW